MRTAIVSGGARGIGRAVVERLGAEGFRVHFLYLSRDDAAGEAVARVAASGGEAVAHRCDVTDREALEAFLARVDGEDVAILVNNVAALRDGHLLLMDEERWDIVLETTLKSAYRLSRGCLRQMLHRRNGRIINIGSLSGLLGQQGQSAYAAAKGGLTAFSRALAREVGRYGVTVNTVVPGWIDTDLVGALSAKKREQAVASVPMGRFGRPEEVAAVVAFLASAAAGYITGATIRVDGGLGA
ncbi:MAG: 3-oxoacyl-ACP reductase family protein [Acidobacteriota bacterium]